MEKIRKWMTEVGLEWLPDKGLEKGLKSLQLKEKILLKELKETNNWDSENKQWEQNSLMTTFFLDRGVVHINDEIRLKKTLGMRIKETLPNCIYAETPYFFNEGRGMEPMITEGSFQESWLEDKQFIQFCTQKIEGYRLKRLFDKERTDRELEKHIKIHMKNDELCRGLADLLRIGLLPIIEEGIGEI